MCRRPLGDLPKAVTAAFLSAAVLALLWPAFCYFTGFQAPWFACLFGGLVSGAVAQASAGRGFAYQAIATTATIVGILAGETLLVLAYWGQAHRLADQELVARAMLSNEYGPPFAIMGVVGGLWLWNGRVA